MLDESKRTTILVLREQGHTIRAIARAVKASRDTVGRVLAAGAPTIPENQRPEKAEAHREGDPGTVPGLQGQPDPGPRNPARTWSGK